MIVWIGLALLSASWLFGLDYYHAANPTMWALLVVAGALCLCAWMCPLPLRRDGVLALLFLVPAIGVTPGPYRIAPILVAIGLFIRVLTPWHWAQRVAGAGMVSGSILLVQALTLQSYMAWTSRSHELPQPLPQWLAAVFSGLGMEVGVHESTIAVHSMRTIHRLGATWELLLDPATISFLVGALVMVALGTASIRPASQCLSSLGRAWGALIFLGAVWLPIRSALYVAIYLNDTLRTDYDASLESMKLFWNPWIHLLLLMGPALVAWRMVPKWHCGILGTLARRASEGEPPEPPGATLSHDPSSLARRASVAQNRATQYSPRVADGAGETVAWRKAWLGPLLVSLTTVLFTMAVVWDPVGVRQRGRVVLEEYHPNPEKVWERTDKPFDTNWYGHLSGYNYFCILDYTSRYYETSRLTEPIHDAALEDCDVLILKIPTRRYTSDEIRAVRRFVEKGGGLLLVGEHTNVFGSGTYLNDIAERFGFRFEYDCLFGVDSVFEQRYESPVVPHPVIQRMPPLDFATSCSILPGKSRGRALIRATGLFSKLADYHSDNYYPQPTVSPDVRYGAFVQLWSMDYGQGRLLAFTDSTIFSNFSTFEPGKPELWLGMIEWLNHRNPSRDPRRPLVILGLLVGVAALVATVRIPAPWIVLLASGWCAWSVTSMGVSAIHNMRMPPASQKRPMKRVVIDRTISTTKLPKNGFIAGKEAEFGIFERWILRLGYFTSRRHGADVFAGDLPHMAGDPADLVVFFYPDQEASPAFLDALESYVGQGGNILVIDSPENIRSTADLLLARFDIAIQRESQQQGTLVSASGWPSIPVEEAWSVQGGDPIAHVNEKPVAVTKTHEKGSVTVVGCGARFTDAHMGATGDVEPNEDLKKEFDWQFALLRTIVEGVDSAQEEGAAD